MVRVVARVVVCVRDFKRLRSTDSTDLTVPIWPPKNPAPPRHLPALPHALLSARVLPHALAGGLVLVLEMVILRVEPTGPQFSLPLGLFFLGAANALLDGPRGLPSPVIAGRTAALGVRCGGGEEGEGEGEGCGRSREETELIHGAFSRFLRQAKRCNSRRRLRPSGSR